MISLADSDVERIAIGDTDILTVSLGRKVLFTFDPVDPLLAEATFRLDASDPACISDTAMFTNLGTVPVSQQLIGAVGTLNGVRAYEPSTTFVWEEIRGEYMPGHGTVIVVVQPLDNGSQVWALSDPSSFSRLYVEHYPAVDSSYVQAYGNNNVGTPFAQAATGSWPDATVPGITAVRIAESNDLIEYWSNSVGPSNVSITGPVSTFATDPEAVRFNGFSDTKALGEFLIWDRALSNAEIYMVQTYLNDKWNLGYTIPEPVEPPPIDEMNRFVNLGSRSNNPANGYISEDNNFGFWVPSLTQNGTPIDTWWQTNGALLAGDWLVWYDLSGTELGRATLGGNYTTVAGRARIAHSGFDFDLYFAPDDQFYLRPEPA